MKSLLKKLFHKSDPQNTAEKIRLAQVENAVDFWSRTMLEGVDEKKISFVAKSRRCTFDEAKKDLEERDRLIGEKIKVFKEKLRERLLESLGKRRIVRLNIDYHPTGILKEVLKQSNISPDSLGPYRSLSIAHVSTFLHPDGTSKLFTDNTPIGGDVLFDGKQRTAQANSLMTLGDNYSTPTRQSPTFTRK